MDLPGTPYKVTLKCPSCGWGFDFGLRQLAELTGGDDGEDQCLTCCSKCLANIVFKPDGTDARVVTPEMLASYSPATQMAVHKGQYLAWLSQHVSKGMMQ